MGTNGTGVPRKLKVNVRDDGPVTLLRVAKERRSEVSTKRGHGKDTPKQEKTEKKIKRDEETDDGKEQKHNHLTTAFATTSNEADNSSNNDE